MTRPVWTVCYVSRDDKFKVYFWSYFFFLVKCHSLLPVPLHCSFCWNTGDCWDCRLKTELWASCSWKYNLFETWLPNQIIYRCDAGSYRPAVCFGPWSPQAGEGGGRRCSWSHGGCGLQGQRGAERAATPSHSHCVSGWVWCCWFSLAAHPLQGWRKEQWAVSEQLTKKITQMHVKSSSPLDQTWHILVVVQICLEEKAPFLLTVCCFWRPQW